RAPQRLGGHLQFAHAVVFGPVALRGHDGLLMRRSSGYAARISPSPACGRRMRAAPGEGPVFRPDRAATWYTLTPTPLPRAGEGLRIPGVRGHDRSRMRGFRHARRHVRRIATARPVPA